MKVDGNGLKHRHGLFWRKSLGLHGFLPHCSRPQRTDGLEVAIQQGARRERGIAVVERNLRSSGSQQLSCRSFRYIQVGIDLVPLDGLTGLLHTVVVAHHLTGLEAVELTDQGACGGRVVEIDNAHGHISRLTFAKDGGEEYDDGNREHHHAETIDGVLSQYATFTAGNTEYPCQRITLQLSTINYQFFIMSDIPGRKPSNFSTGRAFTSKVFRSY